VERLENGNGLVCLLCVIVHVQCNVTLELPNPVYKTLVSIQNILVRIRINCSSIARLCVPLQNVQ